MTQDIELQDGETVQAQFRADRGTYIRANTWLAAGAMAAGMLILWLLGNPYVWTGAVGGLAAVAVRSLYLMSEELAVVWTLTDMRIIGPAGRNIPLTNISEINKLGSFVQIITAAGDKHLIKYQSTPEQTIRSIEMAKSGDVA